jgi:uncharacterized delta-60 repeat protein
LARYNGDGTLDSAFGTGGRVYGPPDTCCIYSTALIIQPDGNIVIAGNAGAAFILRRYTPNGSPDRTFGSDGQVVTPLDSYATAGVSYLALQPDGKLLAGGGADHISCSSVCSVGVVVRYNPDGSLDSAFGTGGKIITTEAAATVGGQSWLPICFRL